MRLRIYTAAQFLTLRLILIGSTHMGRDDSDGPGHAPRYLDVSHMNKRWTAWDISLLVALILGLALLLFPFAVQGINYVRIKRGMS